MDADKYLEKAKSMVTHTNPDVILNGLLMLDYCSKQEVIGVVESLKKEMDKTGYFIALSKAVIAHYIATYIGGHENG